MKKKRLQNGMEVFCLQPGEATFLYQEHFVEKSYLRHGISLDDGACIFDVGANIGMASLFFNTICKAKKIVCVEPLPPLFDVLRANLDLHKVPAKTFNLALSDTVGEIEIVYYPNNSVMSGALASEARDRFVANKMFLNMTGGDQETADMVLANAFETKKFNCPVETLSSVIEKAEADKIDLLKIDVEGAEINVLKGIAVEHWNRISQIVIETHGNTELEQAKNLLDEHGYETAVAQDTNLKGTEVRNLYGRRLR